MLARFVPNDNREAWARARPSDGGDKPGGAGGMPGWLLGLQLCAPLGNAPWKVSRSELGTGCEHCSGRVVFFFECEG